ncbi:acyl-CoA dehydrogenase family protein [Streptomyces sp. P9-A2]
MRWTRETSRGHRRGRPEGDDASGSKVRRELVRPYLSEYAVERIVRDLRAHQLLEGTNEVMQLIVNRAVLEVAA